MSFEIVEKQDFAKRIFLAHFKRDRLAHSYLLSGERGSDKQDVALAFAKALNCKSEHYFEPCDCISCRKVENRTHPDVMWIGEDVAARSIKIEEVRKVIVASTLKPYEGAQKVFIFVDAERMTTDASNALLKTLEEPPPHTVMILLVESKNHLLETLQSRAFEVRMKPAGEREPGENEAIHYWREQESQKHWDEILEGYYSKSRDEVKETLNSLMVFFYDKIRSSVSKPGVAPEKWNQWLDAVDAVRLSKDALAANANQKLILTRLVIHLSKLTREVG